MRLDRGLQPFVRGRPNHHVHIAPEILMDEEPILVSTSPGMMEDDYDEAVLPDLFVLRCELVPTFNHREIQGASSLSGKVCSPSPLWDTLKKPLEKITLRYAGNGRCLIGGAWNEFSGRRYGEHTFFFPHMTWEQHSSRHDIYTKSFLTVTKNLFLTMNLVTEGMHYEPSLDPFYKPFWGYGGSFYPQILLQDIMQYYITLDSDGDETVVQPHSLKGFLAKGVHPDQGVSFTAKGMGKIVFMYAEERCVHSTQTLEDDLVNGCAQLCVSDYFDHSYKSIQAKQLGRSRFVDVTFKKEE